MSQFSCTEVRAKIWRYVDRELPAADLAGLSAHLGECKACQSVYHEKAREAHQYRHAFLASPFGEKFVTRLMERMRVESLIEARTGARSRRMLRGRPLLLSGIAALFLLVPLLVGVVVLSLQPRPVGSFEVRGDPVLTGWIVREGGYDLREVGASRGFYFPGTVFSVPERSVLVLRPALPSSEGATSCEVRGKAFLHVDPSVRKTAFRLFLQVGTVDATVRSLLPGETFVVETPHTVAAVVGTAFRVVVHGDRTVLSVEEGQVRLHSPRRVLAEGEAEAEGGGAAEEGGEAEGSGEAGEALARAGETWLARADQPPERVLDAALAEPAEAGVSGAGGSRLADRERPEGESGEVESAPGATEAGPSGTSSPGAASSGTGETGPSVLGLDEPVSAGGASRRGSGQIPRELIPAPSPEPAPKP